MHLKNKYTKDQIGSKALPLYSDWVQLLAPYMVTETRQEVTLEHRTRVKLSALLAITPKLNKYNNKINH